MKTKKGFTLIEILMVIAILGILAIIVLAALSNSTSKGGDAKVKSQLVNFRTSADLYYALKGGYSDGTIDPIAFTLGGMPIPSGAKDVFASDAAINYGGQAALMSNNLPANSVVFYTRDGSSLGAKATAYAVAATLNGSATAWCVDSTSNSKLESKSGTKWATTDLWSNAGAGYACK